MALRGALLEALVDRDVRKVDAFTGGYRLAVADWPVEPVDPFLNVNRPDDIADAERKIAAM